MVVSQRKYPYRKQCRIDRSIDPYCGHIASVLIVVSGELQLEAQENLGRTGICTILNKLSIPSKAFPLTGTPMTGSSVDAAIIPGR